MFNLHGISLDDFGDREFVAMKVLGDYVRYGQGDGTCSYSIITLGVFVYQMMSSV